MVQLSMYCLSIQFLNCSFPCWNNMWTVKSITFLPSQWHESNIVTNQIAVFVDNKIRLVSLLCSHSKFFKSYYYGTLLENTLTYAHIHSYNCKQVSYCCSCFYYIMYTCSWLHFTTFKYYIPFYFLYKLAELAV